MVVILLGPPGVGKGTQAVILAEGLGWAHVSTGDLLRAARREGTDLGGQAQAFMDRGELVPDELILAMVEEHLAGLPSEQGVLLDGFPRTGPQAEALDGILPGLGRQVDAVVLFTAPDGVLVKRISGRRSCPECGAVYNVHYNPPKRPGRCDRCPEAELAHRADDQEETVVRRLEVYRDLTEPLIRYYQESGARLVSVDADRDVEGIQADVRSELS
jgi:adenylate kinase